MRINYVDKERARACVRVRAYVYVRAHVHAHLRARESIQKPYIDHVPDLCFWASVYSLACLVRARAH